jgi:HEPN domain-containing protein
MSTEQSAYEARGWLTTAEDDLDTAMILKREGNYAHSCFHSQQAGEKALKDLWYFADADPWGHSIRKLIEDLEPVNSGFFSIVQPLNRVAMVLDRFYVPTRYPNGLPDITPDKAFGEEDADTCLGYGKEILDAVRTMIKGA